MTRKKRRKMTFVLMLSFVIASVPVSLSMFFDPHDEPYGNFKQIPDNTSSAGGKILPMLAQK